MRRVVTLGEQNAGGQLVDTEGLVLSSTITGVDPETGALESNPEAQVATAFRNLRRLVDQAGLDPTELALVRISVSPATPLDDAIDKQWQAVFPRANPPTRRVDVYPLPEGQAVQLQLLGVRRGARQPIEGPGALEASLIPIAVKVGAVICSSTISGIDPATGDLVADSHEQVRQAFRNMEAITRAAGGSLDDVGHVFLYVRDRSDNDDVLSAFLEFFPTDGNRTARKNVFVDELRGTDIVMQLQFIAIVGQGKRQNYEVPGAAKKHPNPLGTRIGNLLFSAGIGGQDPAGKEVERQARRALSNLEALMVQAGGSLAHIAQVTFTVDDYAHTPIILDEWRRLFPDPADEPARHIMSYGGRDGSYQIQVHAIAALGDVG